MNAIDPAGPSSFPQSILLLQPRWMGDVLLATPAIREARRAFPEARIEFATESAGAEVLRRNPQLDRVIVHHGGLRSRLAQLLHVARNSYDAVVDFRSTNSTAQLTALSGAPLRVGVRGRGPRNRAYTHLVPGMGYTTYAARHKLDMLAPLGVPVQQITDLRLELTLTDEARDRARRIWADRGWDGRLVVALSPISREAYKQWPAERWGAVADRVSALGATIVVTAAPSEADRVAEFVENLRVPVASDIRTDGVEALGALLERCDLWIGNDGGAKHVAAAVGTPTIAVGRWRIGPVWTDPAAAAPQIFLERPPPQGCDLKCVRCGHRGCLTAVQVDEVAEAVREALA